MSCEHTNRTSTELLITAMEKADEMGQVIVLYRLKEDNGIGWISNAEGITAKLGILEEAKMGMFAHIYGLDTQ